MEMFDDQKNAFVPTLVGLGMLVQVHDPESSELLSRVNFRLNFLNCELNVFYLFRKL